MIRLMYIHLVLTIECFPTVRTHIIESIRKVNGFKMISTMNFLSMSLATKGTDELLPSGCFVHNFMNMLV